MRARVHVCIAIMASKRNDLTLAQKYEVVKTAEREKKIGVRKLSQIFGCGKTQISTVLRNKERIKELYESNASGDRCHTSQEFVSQNILK